MSARGASHTPYTRGGIWAAEVGPKPRPVVIVLNDALCGLMPFVLVAGITTTVRGVRTEVELGTENGVLEGSVVNAIDLYTIETRDLTKYLGECGARLAAIDDALRIALGL